MRTARGCLLLALTAFGIGLGWAGGPAIGAELLMFRRAGCSWCEAWDREVGAIYARTDLVRRAPVRMIDVDSEQPPVALRSRVIYTPTFVLAESGREVGRIEGYPGQDFFWGLVEQLIAQLHSQTNGLSVAPHTSGQPPEQIR
jgi:hypothetical protein